MHKCIKAGVQLLVDIGATNAGRGNWGEGSLFVGGFVAICCVLIGGSSYSTKYLGSVTTLQGVVQCYSMFNRSSSPTPCTAPRPQDNANAVN